MAEKVCAESDIAVDSPMRVVVDGTAVAIVKDSAGAVHAIGDTCTHGDISLAEGFVEGEEHFDPTLYGMAATYDAEGNYIYPEGFDPETGEWLEGFDKQREAWEKQYADARERWEAHTKQVQASRARRRSGISSATSTFTSTTSPMRTGARKFRVCEM